MSILHEAFRNGPCRTNNHLRKCPRATVGTHKYKYTCFLGVGSSGAQSKVIGLLSCGDVPCPGEHHPNPCCVCRTEKPEPVPRCTGMATASSMRHNHGHSLSVAQPRTAAGHRPQQPQSPAGTHKLTREVSAEKGVNAVALRPDQTAQFALLLSKEARRGAAHL